MKLFGRFDFFEYLRGRVRILAEVPKKPLPLEDIRFSIAWCSPFDIKKYRKDLANKIVAGRFRTLTNNIGTDNAGWDCFYNSGMLKEVEKASVIRNSGIITKMDSLKNFPEYAFLYVGEIPNWIDYNQFQLPELRLRMVKGK